MALQAAINDPKLKQQLSGVISMLKNKTGLSAMEPPAKPASTPDPARQAAIAKQLGPENTQQLAQLLMQCLAKGQSKPQSFANMDQAGLRQKYEEMQVKCHEFKSLYKKCVKMIAMLEEQHKSERAEMVSNVSAAKKKDERQAAAIEQLTRQNSGMEQMLLETRQELEREKQVRVALQAQLASAQQDAKRQAIQELLASNDLDDSTAAKLEARLEVEELRYHCEILQEELFHARSNLEALSWSAHELFVDHATEVKDKKARKAAAKAERAAAKAAAAASQGDKPVGKVMLGLMRTTSLGTSPKAPKSGNASPKGPRSGNASPKAPRSGTTSPKAPKSGTTSPKAPRSGNASPVAPRGEGGAWSPKGPRSEGPLSSPKAPRETQSPTKANDAVMFSSSRKV